MGVYVIGDVQGCYAELQRLLDTIGFNAGEDRLWFTGDLVNRGPRSLDVLRFAQSTGAITVLGNHDLHLLAVAAGVETARRKDTFGEILAARDRDELLDWLRRRPLLHHDDELRVTLIHAGLPPQWDLGLARRYAAEVEDVLRSSQAVDFYRHMYGNQPQRWSESLGGWERLRCITNCFTRLRYCSREGDLALEEKGPPGSQPEPFLPWYEIMDRASRDLDIVFGHWSTLGAVEHQGVVALDTGCLWGGQLTALRLDGERRYYAVDCTAACVPGRDG